MRTFCSLSLVTGAKIIAWLNVFGAVGFLFSYWMIIANGKNDTFLTIIKVILIFTLFTSITLYIGAVQVL